MFGWPAPCRPGSWPLIIAVGNDRQFAKLAEILGHPEWASEARFATNAARVANREQLVPLISEIVAARPASDWLAALEAAGIPAGPINSVSQALGDPQAVHRGMIREQDGVPVVGSPLRIDGERQDSTLPPPRLGEHGDVLGEWLNEDDMAALRARGVIS